MKSLICMPNDDLDRLVSDGGVAYAYDAVMSETRTDAYGYNVRNELTSATKTGGPQSPAAEYAYQYDDIGNRITSTDITTNRTYTANSLNQYTLISNLCDSASLREKISQTAQTILDVRDKYPDSSLADLYDPLTMPPDLRAAHAANDRAVLAAYGLKPDTPEPEIVAHLFKLYAEMVEMTPQDCTDW